MTPAHTLEAPNLPVERGMGPDLIHVSSIAHEDAGAGLRGAVEGAIIKELMDGETDAPPVSQCADA